MSFVARECSQCNGTGVITSLEYTTFDGIRSHTPMVLEVPCQTCGGRMEEEGSTWECQICNDTRQLDRSVLMEELSDGMHNVCGMPGALGGDCPLCEDGRVNGGPDGELYCNNCSDNGGFYAGQYTNEWFAYAEWLNDGPVVVNELKVKA